MGRQTVVAAENQAEFGANKAIDAELRNGWLIRKKRVQGNWGHLILSKSRLEH